MPLILETLLYNAGNITYLFSQWIIAVIIARIGGFSDAGIFALAMSVSNIFGIFALYGMRTYQITDSAKTYSDSEYTWARIITVIVSFVLCCVYAFSANSSITVIYTIIGYMIYKSCEAYSDVLNGIWQRYSDTKKVSVSMFLKGILNFVSFLIIYISTKNLVLAVFGMALSSLLVLVTYDYIITKRYNSELYRLHNLKSKKVSKLLQVGLITMLNSLAIALTASLPKIIIEKLLNEEKLGYFSSISAPTIIISTIAVGIAIPLIPKLSDLYNKKDYKSLYKFLVLYISFFFILGIAAEIFSFFFGSLFLKLLFGAEILKYEKLLYILIISSSLTAVLCCYSGTLISYRKVKMTMIFSSFCAIIIVPLLYLLINKYDLYGAAYALIIAQAIQLIPETFYIIKVIHSLKRDRIIA